MPKLRQKQQLKIACFFMGRPAFVLRLATPYLPVRQVQPLSERMFIRAGFPKKLAGDAFAKIPFNIYRGVRENNYDQSIAGISLFKFKSKFINDNPRDCN